MFDVDDWNQHRASMQSYSKSVFEKGNFLSHPVVYDIFSMNNSHLVNMEELSNGIYGLCEPLSISHFKSVSSLMKCSIPVFPLMLAKQKLVNAAENGILKTETEIWTLGSCMYIYFKNKEFETFFPNKTFMIEVINIMIKALWLVCCQ